MRGTAVCLSGLMCLILCSGGMSTACGEEQEATPSKSIHVHPGFHIELLHSAGEDDGSWISMTFDDQGRLIVARDDAGLVRVTLSGPSSPLAVETLENTSDLKHCRGVLYAHQSLYVSATNTPALYRLRDLDGDDQFDEPQLLRKMDYRSRYGHGTNQIVLGPDRNIYWVIGNDVSFPEGFNRRSPYRNPQNDWALPHPHDAGHDDRVGSIVRSDPDGETWTIVAGGFRNQVDAAFNVDGELFTWDADMEWDAGLPWYRPTRINHVVSGGEYGWRWGTGKWAEWYPDSLPTTHDTGYGSPTGLEFGTNSNWPDQFRRLLFAADWQNGRMLAVDLIPKGSTYSATSRLFLEGAPLNICDFTFGPDGAMYFITGGRKSQTGLYRVSYVGPEPPADSKDVTPEQRRKSIEARTLRHKLEELQVRIDPGKIRFIAQHLGAEDRWIRFAARVALENQPVDQWRHLFSEAAYERTSLTVGLALARKGTVDDQALIWNQYGTAEWQNAGDDTLLWRLRTLQISVARHGLPDTSVYADVLQKVEAIFPYGSYRVNRLASELLAGHAVSQSDSGTRGFAGEFTDSGRADSVREDFDQCRAFVVTRMNVCSFWSGCIALGVWLVANWLTPTMSNLKTDFLGQLTDDELAISMQRRSLGWMSHFLTTLLYRDHLETLSTTGRLISLPRS